jgi:hypothetical protein
MLSSLLEHILVRVIELGAGLEIATGVAGRTREPIKGSGDAPTLATCLGMHWSGDDRSLAARR